MAWAAGLPQVHPISDLRTRLNEIESAAKETRQPIVLTRNGAASLVVMDSEAFNEHIRHERAVRKLREAEIEAKYRPDAIPHDEVAKRVAALLEAGAALQDAQATYA